MKSPIIYIIGIIVQVCLSVLVIILIFQICAMSGKFSQADRIHATKEEVAFLSGNVDGNNELFKQIVSKGLGG